MCDSSQSGGLRVDLWSQECSLDGELLQLSPTEYALLTFLMTHPGQALPTHTIVREVWGWFTSDGKNVLRIFVNRLRRKLHDDFRNPQFIASVRGTGYRFIRNVAEIGDGADPAAERTDVTLLLQSVEQLAVGLLECTSVDAAGDCVPRRTRRHRLRRRHGAVPARRQSDAARRRAEHARDLDGERRETAFR